VGIIQNSKIKLAFRKQKLKLKIRSQRATLITSKKKSWLLEEMDWEMLFTQP
jgi:hypothetical protein